MYLHHCVPNAVPTNLFYLFYPITLGGRRGTTDEFATILFQLDLFLFLLISLLKVTLVFLRTIL